VTLPVRAAPILDRSDVDSPAPPIATSASDPLLRHGLEKAIVSPRARRRRSAVVRPNNAGKTANYLPELTARNAVDGVTVLVQTLAWRFHDVSRMRQPTPMTAAAPSPAMPPPR
jgi:hypothetical protein